MAVELGSVRPLVADSWARSASAGAGEDASHLPAIRLAPEDLAGYRTEHPLAPLVPMVRELLEQTARSEDCLIAVVDADGTLLWIEGPRAVAIKAERMNFVEGAVWTEAAAGTNAPGTALAIGEPVRIRELEHYNTAVQQWSCSAVPIHGPGGDVLGVIDVTGDARAVTPQAMALVRATVRAGEAELARRTATADRRALTDYLDRQEWTPVRPTALLTRSGCVLHATGGVNPRVLADLAPITPGRLVLPDGRSLAAEPIGRDGHLVIRIDNADRTRPLRLTALGRDCAELEIDGRVQRLSHRHSEIVVALTLMGGVSGGRLAVELSDAEIRQVNLRVEMSRLRAILGTAILGSRPYELLRPVRSDFADVRDLLADGRVEKALAAYAGPLLPWSDAPVIVDFRRMLEQQLCGAVLASRSPALLRRWVDAPWGSDDSEAWRMLANALPGGSAQRAAAVGRARALLHGEGRDDTSLLRPRT